MVRCLETHPAAKDTVDGMAQGWRRRVGRLHRRRDIARAGALLCAHDLLLAMRRTGLPPDDQHHPQQRQAIAQLLSDTDGL